MTEPLPQSYPCWADGGLDDCVPCDDGPDAMPCTLREGHEGDHENFYAQRSWPRQKAN